MNRGFYIGSISKLFVRQTLLADGCIHSKPAGHCWLSGGLHRTNSTHEEACGVWAYFPAINQDYGGGGG